MLPGDSAISSLDTERLTAAEVCRGTCRLFERLGHAVLDEVPLGCGRRADVMALDAAGCLTIVEIKVSVADLRGDAKWHDYLDHCDRFFWAVPVAFAAGQLDEARYRPELAGVIIADRFDAIIAREAATRKLSAPRRKSETLRFGRLAASRLMRLRDPFAGA
jgi:hypothetical protein